MTIETEKPSEATLRLAQALGEHMGRANYEHLAQAALEAMGSTPQELLRLTEALHARSAHPDWEYATTGGSMPVGEGWVVQYSGEEGVDWRRRLSFKVAEQEMARQPLLDAIARLRRCAEWLRAQKDKIEKDIQTNDYWAKQTYAQGIGGAVDGDYGSLAARFGPVPAQWLATSLEAYAEDLSYHRVELNAQTTCGLLALAESLEPSPAT